MKKKKKTIRVSQKGCIYIHASFNNTIISITDEAGGLLSWATAGSAGFKGTKKSTPFAAQIATKNAIDKAIQFQLKSVKIFVSGVGNGRDAVLRAISSSPLEVISIKDTTPIAHNGVRHKKPRRV